MHLMLIGFGSRGDVQPMIPLAKALQASGFQVTFAGGSNFQSWVESEGIRFVGFTTDVEAMMNSETGKEWVENSSNSSAKEAQNMRQMVREHAQTMTADLWRICEQADVLVSGLPTFGIVESIAEITGKPHIRIMLAPLSPTKVADSTMVPVIPRRDIFLNRWAGYIGIYFTWWIFQEAIQQFRREKNLSPMSYQSFTKAWNQRPVVYGVSPLVMPKAPDWNDTTYVTGFWFYQQSQTWQAPQSLVDFLAQGAKPVYIGFGSMSNKNPQATTEIMLNALAKTEQRGIIYTGWAGLHAEDLPANIYLLSGAPHDWLFPQMAAVIHHGGAGTTAAGLRAAVPSSVVAHMADQPYWGRRIHELGVGAPLIRRHDLSVTKLASAIDFMLSKPEIARNAARLGAQICQEEGIANAVKAFQAILKK